MRCLRICLSLLFMSVLSHLFFMHNILEKLVFTKWIGSRTTWRRSRSNINKFYSFFLIFILKFLKNKNLFKSKYKNNLK